jgi:hypothetical protein
MKIDEVIKEYAPYKIQLLNIDDIVEYEGDTEKEVVLKAWKNVKTDHGPLSSKPKDLDHFLAKLIDCNCEIDVKIFKHGKETKI